VLDEEESPVDSSWNQWTVRGSIAVNGVPVLGIENAEATGNLRHFEIGLHACRVIVVNCPYHFEYELNDGKVAE
jgi:hypothetical protein